MAKKDDSLDAWRYRYPSGAVSWSFIPDSASCQQFVGYAKNMLYRLKNRMNIAVPKLKSLRDERSPEPGTTITVMSIFGQDFIEIKAGRGFPSCSITLPGVPEAVQPMHWYADGIHKEEVEGIDYIKTYYAFVIKDCPTCDKLDFTICDTTELAKDTGFLTGGTQCIPFKYRSEDDNGKSILFYQDGPVPYFQGFPLADPPIPSDPMNHQIQSVYNHCQAEIISFGHDDGGSYFLWKAYTEWSNLGPFGVEFTQSGLGYLLLRGFIKRNGVELCMSKPSIIKVDCCLKTLADRTPQIYWEKCIGGGWCVAPTNNSIEVDLVYFWQLGGWISMPLWAKGESCIQMTWSVSGIGEVITSGDGMVGNYRVPFADLMAYVGCTEPKQISIEGTDRCGTKDIIIFASTPCCEGAAPLEIGYTLLQMSCGGSQTFTASGGCGPYVWSLSGGGTLTPNEDTTQAGYVAPASNANCSDNPTITITDCCGGSASISLAVNCYTLQTVAVQEADLIKCCCYKFQDPGCAGMTYQSNKQIHIRTWDCASNLLSNCNFGVACGDGNCPPPPPCANFCPCDVSDEPGCWNNYNCSVSSGACQTVGSAPCNEAVDRRTQVMKDAGCCPLNPITGLPF